MIVFSQGSCRVGFPLTYLHGQKKIELIDPHWDAIENEIGDIPAMALGHFHNIDDHLRVFRLLQDDSDIVELKEVLNQINGYPINPKKNRYRLNWEDTWEHCKTKFTTCDIAVIELCSFKPVKFLSKNGRLVSDKIEIQSYIKKIDDLTPHCKKLWVCHFRPNVLWDKNSQTRETLFHAIKEQTEHYFDPTPFLKTDEKTLMRDDKHYSPYGIKFIGERMLEKMKSM
jgi:hypothetical protein